jgi:hypothetical protein
MADNKRYVNPPLGLHPATLIDAHYGEWSDGEDTHPAIIVNIEMVFTLGDSLPIASIVHRLREIANGLIMNYIKPPHKPVAYLMIRDDQHQERQP